MSNPAQPSFVWQLYHYDLEPNASLFAVMHAAELQHIQFNESTGELQVINNLPTPLAGAIAHVTIYNLDGTVASEHDTQVTAAPVSRHQPRQGRTSRCGLHLSTSSSSIFTTRKASSSPRISTGTPCPSNPTISPISTICPQSRLKLNSRATSSPNAEVVTVTLHNPTSHIALMAHLQLRRAHSGERVLPVFSSDNYISLVPNETRTITSKPRPANSRAKTPQVVVDGWNVTVAPASAPGVSIAPNIDAEPGHWPTTGLPYQTVGLR